MMFKRSILATFICTTLAACGGSGGSSDNATATPEPTVEPTPEPLSFTGKAADGYLVDAKACLDLNANKQCDDDEPQTMTGAGGVFTIEGVTQKQIDSAALLVEVGLDTTDEDTGEKVQKAYKLSAPAGSDFVSPITTLVQNEIEKGSTVEEAKQAVKQKLGTNIDVEKDYVALKKSDELTEEEKQEYETLHKIAQVTATVIANNTETLEQVAPNADISVEELTAIIVEEVNKALETIVEKVAEAEQNQGEVGEGEEKPKFDPTSIANEVDDEHIDLDEDNLKDKVLENEAEKSATAADLGELIKGDGINWFYGEKEDDRQIELEYGNLKIDEEGNAIETVYYLNDEMDGFEMEVIDADAEEDDALQRMLTADGWVTEDDDIVSVNINDDGSIELVMQTPALNETATAKQVNIGDLKVGVVLAESGGNGAWAKVLPKDAIFPADTIAYRLKTQSSISQFYSFYEGDWCDEERKTTLNGMCNGAEIIAADGTRYWGKTLAEFNGQKHYVMGIDQAEVAVEMAEGGVLNFYAQKWGDAEFTKLEGVGTWQDITVHGQTLRELVLPDSIAMRDDIRWNNFNEEDNKQYLAVVDDYVRVSWSQTRDNADGEYVFDKATQDYIVSKFDFDLYHPKTLASCLASLPDNGYMTEVGEVFEYHSQRSVSWVNDGAITDYNERFEVTSLTATWPANEKGVTGLPAWITDTQGKLEKTQWTMFNQQWQPVGFEHSYADMDNYYGQEGVDGQGMFVGYGAAKAVLLDDVAKDQMMLNETYNYEFANFAVGELYNAEQGASFDDFNIMEYEYSQTYLGKYTVWVPAGSFDTCKVISKAKLKGSEAEADTDISWSNNRGMIKQEQNNPSWAPVYNRQATRVPY